MRASRVSRAIVSPSRELRRSLTKSMFDPASQSARPYLLSTARISVQRLTLRYRCGMERTLITEATRAGELLRQNLLDDMRRLDAGQLLVETEVPDGEP